MLSQSQHSNFLTINNDQMHIKCSLKHMNLTLQKSKPSNLKRIRTAY